MSRKFRICVIGLILSVLLSFLFVAIYKLDNERVINMGSVEDYNNQPEGYVFIVDNSISNDNFVQVNGCAAKLGENLDYVNNRIILIDNRNQLYGLNTVMVKRPSATDYFNDGFNYDNSGLRAYGRRNDLDKGIYKIGIVIQVKEGMIYLMQSDYSLEVK